MTITIPESPAEVEELLNDTKKLGELIKEGKFGDAMKAYADKVMNAKNGDLTKQLREEMQVAMAEWLKENEVDASKAQVAHAVEQRIDGRLKTSAERALNNPHALGNRLEGIFNNSGELFQAFTGSPRVRAKYAQQVAQYTQIMNSFGSEVPDAGGFLIPEILRSQLLSVALETAVVRPRATVIPMDSLRVPIPIVDDTSHVSNVFGGVQWYWTEEAAALTESQATFGRVVLDAKKLTAYATVPNELLDDAPAFSGFLEAKFPQALAFGEDVGFFTGTGTGEPLGFINCAASVNVAKQTGQLTNTILWENIVGMYARMLPTSLGNAVWVCAIDTFPQLATMALAVGTGGGPVWIGNFAGGQGGSQAPPMSILGRPVIFTEKASALSTAGDINFVDLSYYLIGDRMTMQSMTSEHYLFANDKIAFRIIERVDGRPWLQSAITPHNNSTNTLTAFVQLASR